MSTPVEQPHGVLADELAAVLDGNVRFDIGSRVLYATDASNYRHLPIGVVEPRSIDDVIATVSACHRHRVPVLSRGAGTGLCGQTCNEAVVIDFSRHLNRIEQIDVDARTARVQPGLVLDTLRDAARQHGLTFAPDPATHNHNTLGGMIGNNSCGPHSVMGGTTVANVIALDVLTIDGERFKVRATDDAEFERIQRAGGRRAEIYRQLRELVDECDEELKTRYPEIPRRVSGYNLTSLLPENGFDLAKALVGSEGTCVVVLGATLRLVPEPAQKVLLVLGYPSVYEAADHVVEVLQHGPVAIEGVDRRLVEDMRRNDLHAEGIERLPAGDGWLLVEFGGGTVDEAKGAAVRLMEHLGSRDSAPAMKLLCEPSRQKQIWDVREAGLGATAHVPGEALTWEGWEDAAVPPQHLGEYLRGFRDLLKSCGYRGDLYGHFGDGCVHTRIDFDLASAGGIRHFRRFIDEAARLVVRFGGSISGEHGDGQSKAELLPLMFGHSLVETFGRFKQIWDPQNLLNPGRVVDARSPDQDLRLGANYRPRQFETRMYFAEDSDDFSRATLRCVGVGECRKNSGTMCPSFMATGDEMHSTRGRAHLLHEMMSADTLPRGWREPVVREALSLCLSCKACRKECPVAVDMANYKAEFMYHHYRRRLRPPFMNVFGRIDRWARAASLAPRLVNAAAANSLVSRLAKLALSIAPQRPLPRFAPQTFRQWFADREPCVMGERGELLLWPDTFNNHLQPEVAQAAVAVLEAAGWRVRLPQKPLCCGRPLYEFGLLDAAERYLRKIVDVLDTDLVKGTPIVVLEPACLSVFKEELPRMLPRDRHARRLCEQSIGFDQFVRKHARLDQLPGMQADGQRLLMHPHCHQRAIHGVEDERALLRQLGFELDTPDTGCCGMAGAFGYERDKYDVSIACAERVLLPAVRLVDESTVLLSDGYSCREQIDQNSGRQARHLAQVLASLLERSARNDPSRHGATR